MSLVPGTRVKGGVIRDWIRGRPTVWTYYLEGFIAGLLFGTLGTLYICW